MKLFCALIMACITVSCNNQSFQPVNDRVDGKQTVFPVTDFLNSQMHMVDSLQLPVMKFVTINNKTDSGLISWDEFKVLAADFLQPDISDPSISGLYKENSFADQSIPSVTLTYAAQNKDLEIRRVDITINPNPVLYDKVRSIYLEKNSIRKDTFIHKKLYWRADRNFQIITTMQLQNQPSATRILKCIWDYTD